MNPMNSQTLIIVVRVIIELKYVHIIPYNGNSY